jgi:hypothetical protein
MTYSMVGAPALGYDLARLPHGEQVAVVVRTALRLTPRDLRRLSARRRGVSRPEVAHVSGRHPEPMSAALPVAGEAFERELRGDLAGSAELLHRLERAALGNVDSLARFLRQEVLDWTWSSDGTTQSPEASRAGDILVDAAASAYCVDETPRRRRELVTPFLGSGVAPVDATTGTAHPGLDQLLAEVARCDAPTRGRWRAAVDDLRGQSLDWAPAMHQATWALSLSQRLRLATDAQMAAVMAFRAGGFTLQDAAYGVWNAISGAVQATAVADLLGDDDHRTLVRAWHRVHDGS